MRVFSTTPLWWSEELEGACESPEVQGAMGMHVWCWSEPVAAGLRDDRPDMYRAPLWSNRTEQENKET